MKRNGRRIRYAAALGLLCSGFSSTADLPAYWVSKGAGGGGALFAPSFSPHLPDELYIACDMSEVFRSTDLGRSWNVLNFRSVQGNRGSVVHFTSNPLTLYTLDYSVVGGYDLVRPSRSLDGGLTWQALVNDPTGGELYSLFADPNATNRLLIADYSRVFMSSDGGATWTLKFQSSSNGNGCNVGGVFWDGQNIFVGTSAGLYVSSNGGGSFAPGGPALPPGEHLFSLAGAKEGGTVRLFITTMAAGSVWGGMFVEETFWNSYRGIYTLDWGQAAWIKRVTGIPAGVSPALVAMARNTIGTAYVSGQDGAEYPIVYKTSDGGVTWQSVLLPSNNQNIRTGWSGFGGDRGWTYGAGVVGFAVAPLNANRVAFTDYGFCHVTADGGITWRQAYVNEGDEHPAGASIPRGASYRSVGLEDTTCWWMQWFDSNTIFASFSDITGLRSADGGATWGFSFTGQTFNSSYQSVKHANGSVYLAVATVHDMYQSTRLQDSILDNGDGEVKVSADQGRTWQTVHDFNENVFGLALDPNNPNRMIAGVIHSTLGGLYQTTTLLSGPASVWQKLANPPRTEGHPHSIHILKDGTLVCTYSGRRNASGAFTASSGVFVSTDGGATWADRSHPNMVYWTKDLVIDPHDPTESVWYVGVFSGWGGPPNGKGGLYRTHDRGQTWTRISALDRVTSCSINPALRDEMYLTTEVEGLWFSSDAASAAPVFKAVTNYPFRQPERVFFNPYREGEVWVTSFGHGLRVGAGSPIPRAVAPILTLPGGVYTSFVAVGLASATSNATVRFTLDGSEPTENSAAGTSVVVEFNSLLRARAFAPGMLPSDTISAYYTFSDTDGDILPDWVETGTGTYLSPTNTGTSPTDGDTDDDGRSDFAEVKQGSDPLNPESVPRALGDFDGDAVCDLAVYHPARGDWYISESASGALRPFNWGWSEAVPVPADYDGDGLADVAVYHPARGDWYIFSSASGAMQRFNWGWQEAVPVPADYDGDGRADLAVYHAAIGDWFVFLSKTGDLWKQNWGWGEARPVPADYDGDGRADLAVFHPAKGNWFIRRSSTSELDRQNWGWSEVLPVPADYDGDRRADLAAYHPASGQWFIWGSTAGARAPQVFGWSAARPVFGDYDGDGRAELTVYHREAGTWYIGRTTLGFRQASWGWSEAYPPLAPVLQ